MEKIRSTIRLLSLFSIYFIYKTIAGVIENNFIEFVLWLVITIVYAISLTIGYLVALKWEKI
jgi:hypothetical protein